jgi:hypothetical protein
MGRNKVFPHSRWRQISMVLRTCLGVGFWNQNKNKRETKLKPKMKIGDQKYNLALKLSEL